MSTYNDAIRHTAHVWVHHETGKITLTIRRAIPAGIDGPFGGLDEVANMAQVEEYLRDHGYAVRGGWVFYTNYAGLNLDADLIRVDQHAPGFVNR